MGIWRFVLALAVVVYHAGGAIQVLGAHIGVSAVVGFYIVSGYAITGLLDRHFISNGSVDAGAFYKERFIRLAPQYYFYLAFTATVIFGFGIRWPAFHSGALTFVTILSNLTVVPLSLVTVSPEIQSLQIMPQGWSLGTEIVFYLLFPWIIASRSRVYLATIASLIIAFLAITNILQNDGYGYRMLPGVLIFFLAGHFIQRRNWLGLNMVIIGLAINALLAATFFGFDSWINRSVYLGAAVGIAAVLFIRDHKPHPIDTMLGAASYGIYLSHLTIRMLLRHYDLVEPQSLQLVVATVVISTLSGLATFWFIERPTVALRRRYRLN